MKGFFATVGVLVGVVFGGFMLVSGLTALGWIGRVQQVAMQEIDPAVLLKKYEWFKNAAAELDKKRSDTKVYEHRITAMAKSYGSTPRPKWSRDDREQANLWESEVAGVKASYNGLAAEYNAQMSKINWRFCEIGNLPKGATDPLPREYKPYVEE